MAPRRSAALRPSVEQAVIAARIVEGELLRDGAFDAGRIAYLGRTGEGMVSVWSFDGRGGSRLEAVVFGSTDEKARS